MSLPKLSLLDVADLIMSAQRQKPGEKKPLRVSSVTASAVSDERLLSF